MSRPVKALFFDIDGTLIDHSSGSAVMPASTLACLRAAREKGIRLFVATGRPLEMVGFLEEYFDFDGFLCFNGQLVVERDGRVVHRLPHREEDIRRLLELVREDPFPCLIQEQEDKFFVTESPLIRQHYEWAGLPQPRGPYDPARLERHPVLQFLAYIPYEEALRRLAPLEHVAVTTSGGPILDVIPKEGGKDVGIAAAAAHYGWRREEIMAFGDGDNDAEMLRWAGIGVAMGNAGDAPRAAADYVTTPVGRDGIQNALLHFRVLEDEDLRA